MSVKETLSLALNQERNKNKKEQLQEINNL